MLRQHIVPLAILAGVSMFSLVYATREKSEANALTNSRDQLRVSLADARAEIETLSAKVNSLTDAVANAQAPRPPVEALPAAPVRPRAAARPRVRPKPVEDPRWRRVESQLAEQRERIAETQEAVRKTGDELDGKITSTRDELNRSIATTHEEVVVLQKRGERNIYEFDLEKSKQFQRVGPLSLSLRKSDTKHRNYNLSLMADDKPVDKEHVNLLEPVWVTPSGQSQPIQIVVNKIEKNRVHGYISEPRYKNADVAAAPAPATGQAPALKSR